MAALRATVMYILIVQCLKPIIDFAKLSRISDENFGFTLSGKFKVFIIYLIK